MKVELCTWQTRPGGVPRTLEALRNAAPSRRGGGTLAGVWTTDSGELNQVVHLWSYEGPVQGVDADWPGECTDPLAAYKSAFMVPAPFSPSLQPKTLGAIYEFRFYTLPTEALPGLIRRWAPVIEWRASLSPLVGVWHTEGEAATCLLHVWAYRDANDWQRIRGEARRSGMWPPSTNGAPSTLISQRSILALPADFSPLA